MCGSWTLTPLRLCSSSVAQAPGECSFLKSPDDLQTPLPAPRGAQAVLLAVGLPEPYAFLSSVIRWWAAFSWHTNIGREEMPKLRSWHGGDCWRAGLEAPCLLPFSSRLHLASAFHGERRVNSRGLFFNTQRERSEGSSRTMRVPRCQNSYSLELVFQSLLVSLSSGRQGPDKMGEGQVPQSSTCHLAPHSKPWWT